MILSKAWMIKAIALRTSKAVKEVSESIEKLMENKKINVGGRHKTRGRKICGNFQYPYSQRKRNWRNSTRSNRNTGKKILSRSSLA